MKRVKIKAAPESNLYIAGMVSESYILEIEGIQVKEYGDIFEYLKTKLEGDMTTVKVENIESGEVSTYTFELGDWESLSNKEEEEVEPEGINPPK